MGAKATKIERDVRADHHLLVPADDRRRPKNGKNKTNKTNKAKTNANATRTNSRAPRPWTPSSPTSHSTDFTVSTDKSTGRHRVSSSASSGSEIAELPLPTMAERTTNNSYHQQVPNNRYHQPQQHQQQYQQKDRRIIEAEKILGEIAKEYAAKRAAGLVPTKPVPARTLLWEELAQKSTQAGRRGQCIFGRDTDNVCGCTSYKKVRVPGQVNPGGVCECCGHGGPWHRLMGGTMARSSRMSRSILASSARGSHLETGSYVPSEARSSMYDYDSDEYEDDEDDDEAIANEMAVPSNFYPVVAPPPVGALGRLDSNQDGMMDRTSLLSIGSSYGFPSRLSSGTNSLGALLQAIQRYRDMGLEEDEIESRIREDFPPVPRKSSVAARSDISQSQVDI